MITINSLLTGKEYTVTKSKRTERGDLINAFMERVNEINNKKEKFATFAHFLSPYSVSDLYVLWKRCGQAKNFASCFWWHVNPKK